MRSLQDPVGIRDALLLLVNRPDLRARLGAAGRRVAMARFSPARLAKEYENLYRALLAEKKPDATQGQNSGARVETLHERERNYSEQETSETSHSG